MRLNGEQLSFADVFAGCGGLSLGLLSAGWKGTFAIEKNADAFKTLSANLLERKEFEFDWPEGLDKSEHDIIGLLRSKKQRKSLDKLRGRIDLLVGGPPCQGFSSAGRRDPKDPRNQLFKRYLKLVGILQPKMLLIENVQGISSTFKARANGKSTKPVSEKICKALERRGYKAFHSFIRASDLGVPQMRRRFFLIGIRRESFSSWKRLPNPFDHFPEVRASFLANLGLTPGQEVSVSDAISDLQTSGAKTEPCHDSAGFFQIVYTGPQTSYQEQMRKLASGHSMNGHTPNSLRLPKHSKTVATRFEAMVRDARKGVSLSDAERKHFGVKKMSIVVLHPDRPSHTLTTLPDDLVHYSEGRILTVREYARIQSFPDWFKFLGTYTTGGKRRKQSCPRYTQVGNAVPPRVASFLGELVRTYLKALAR